MQTTGALIAAVGLALLVGDRSRTRRWLGIGSAAALGLCDVVFAARGRISRIYLVDGLVEAGVILAWL